MDFIEIEIIKWASHQRKDVKKPSWFAMDNRILEDAKLFDLTDSEWKALLYIFCQASQQRSETVRINYAHAKRVCALPEKTIDSAISQLCNAGVTRTARARNVDVTDTSRERTADVTPQDRTGQDKTRHHEHVDVSVFQTSWNELVASLPKAKTWGNKRRLAEKKILEEFKIEDWDLVCQMIEGSEFLSGRNGKWDHCSIDWVLKKENFVKVLEGNYNRDLKAVAGDMGSISGLVAE